MLLLKKRPNTINGISRFSRISLSVNSDLGTWKILGTGWSFDFCYKKPFKKLKRSWLLRIPHLFYAPDLLPLTTHSIAF